MMNPSSKLFQLGLLEVASLLALTSWQEAWAESGGNTVSGGSDPIAMYLATGIDKQQESKIRQRVEEFKKLTFANGETMVRLMKEMRVLSMQPDLDAKAINSKQEEINSLNNQMAMERNKMLQDLRHVLTAPQRKKFVELMQDSPNIPLR